MYFQQNLNSSHGLEDPAWSDSCWPLWSGLMMFSLGHQALGPMATLLVPDQVKLFQSWGLCTCCSLFPDTSLILCTAGTFSTFWLLLKKNTPVTINLPIFFMALTTICNALVLCICSLINNFLSPSPEDNLYESRGHICLVHCRILSAWYSPWGGNLGSEWLSNLLKATQLASEVEIWTWVFLIASLCSSHNTLLALHLIQFGFVSLPNFHIQL